MKKFTDYERSLIITCLNEGLSLDLAKHQEVEAAGKIPIMTAGFIKQTYQDLIEKVNEMTKKK